jgi:hypothetical protein
MASRIVLPTLTKNVFYCHQSKRSLHSRTDLRSLLRRQRYRGEMKSSIISRHYNNATIPARESIYEETLASSQTFPSIVIASQGRIEPQGSFAEAQAQVSDEGQTFYKSLRRGVIGMTFIYFLNTGAYSDCLSYSTCF